MTDPAAGPRRLEKLAVESLDHEQRALYDAIVGGPRAQGPQPFALTDEAGGLEGPFNAMLLSPALGQALQALGAGVRYQTRLSARAREIAILVVAAQWESGFETYAHQAVGRAAGLSEDELSAVSAGRFADLEDPVERLVATTVATLAAQGDLGERDYADAVDELGARTLFELTSLVGYYATLALQLRVFRVPLPPSGSTPVSL